MRIVQNPDKGHTFYHDDGSVFTTHPSVYKKRSLRAGYRNLRGVLPFGGGLLITELMNLPQRIRRIRR